MKSGRARGLARIRFDPAAADILKSIRKHNPLLSDFVLKRTAPEWRAPRRRSI